MLRSRTLALIFGSIVLCAACMRRTGVVASDGVLDAGPAGKALVWSDEFDGEGLPDPARWAYDVGGAGWGNNELQYYTEARTANARQADGHLVIEAHREDYENRGYTSARLVTRGKADWTYGYIEARIRVARGLGAWSAFWMLGHDIAEVGWPRCGEIDIMEHVGYAPDSLHGTVHTAAFNHVQGTQVGHAIAVDGLQDDFHVFAVDWDADRIEWLLDGEVYHRFDRREGATEAEWPFDEPQHLLLNLAVGGSWGGRYGVDTTIWPRRMAVDYVRVWQ